MIPSPPEPLRDLYLVLALAFALTGIVSFIEYVRNRSQRR